MQYADILKFLPQTALNSIPALPCNKIATGKVRENFDLGDALLISATDRLSAFDVIMHEGIPGKGIILTQMSNWWFAQTAHIIQNHLLPDQPAQFKKHNITDPNIVLRSMITRKLKPLKIECIVRGYLAGSGWESYKQSGTVCDIPLPAGLRQSEKLPEPLFTPTTKAPKGEHDAPINDTQAAAIVGEKLYQQVKTAAIALYKHGHDRAQKAGIILADTKFEFGTDEAGNLVLIDEILTPDSSRYWPLSSYALDTSPPSYDKQFVRDHLLSLNWNQQPPPPTLPNSVIIATRDKYLQALQALLATT